MSFGTPGASALFPAGQQTQQFSPWWGVYASVVTLPNGGGNALNASRFKLQVGHTAWVTGAGYYTCASPGTAGGGDAVWTPSSGNVNGPAVSTDNAIVRWDGTTGRVVQDSVVVVTDPGVVQPSTAGQGLSAGGTITTQNTPAFTLLNSGSFTGAAGATQIQTKISATVNQSATAAFTLLDLATTETALGSGNQYLINAKAGAGGATQVFALLNGGQAKFPTGTAAVPAVEIGGFTYGNAMGLHRATNTALVVAQGGVNYFSFDASGTFDFTTLGFKLRQPGNGPMIIGGNTSSALDAVLYINDGNVLVGTGVQFGTIEFFGVNQSGAGSFVAHQVRMGLAVSGAGGAPVFGTAGGWFYEGQRNGATMFSVSENGGIANTAVSPAALAAGTTNDYAGTGVYGWARLTSDGAGSVVTGFVATNIRDGHELTIAHIAGLTLTINHQDAGSTAANRVITATGAAIVLGVDDNVVLKYDLTTARWRQITGVA